MPPPSKRSKAGQDNRGLFLNSKSTQSDPMDFSHLPLVEKITIVEVHSFEFFKYSRLNLFIATTLIIHITPELCPNSSILTENI